MGIGSEGGAAGVVEENGVKPTAPIKKRKADAVEHGKAPDTDPLTQLHINNDSPTDSPSPSSTPSSPYKVFPSGKRETARDFGRPDPPGALKIYYYTTAVLPYKRTVLPYNNNDTNTITVSTMATINTITRHCHHNHAIFRKHYDHRQHHPTTTTTTHRRRHHPRRPRYD